MLCFEGSCHGWRHQVLEIATVGNVPRATTGIEYQATAPQVQNGENP